MQDVCSKKKRREFPGTLVLRIAEKERSNLKRKVERLERLNPEDVTGVSQKISAEFLDKLVFLRNEKP